MKNAENYTWLEQLLHRLAFRSVWMQKEIANIEDDIFLKQTETDSINKPVFITSMPRAGTTLLLEILHEIPVFACHSYRDMPFIFCPVFWDKISGAFRKKATLKGRAHGDGIEISYDSPEAFEEAIWLAFWPKKYSKDQIQPWSATDRQQDFEKFLKKHILKIIALRSDDNNRGLQKRYLSKNNANIARLELLKALFPNCRIIIPIRNPWDHVRSLFDQHRRFSQLHSRDRFSQEYMEWLGHFEFGAGLRPINFGNWMDEEVCLDPFDEKFWFTYWVHAYEGILEASSPNMYFFNYDRACEEPVKSLKDLSLVLELEESKNLLSQGARFRMPTRYVNPGGEINSALRARVEATYEALITKADSQLF